MTHTPTPWEWRDDQTGYKGVWSIRPGILIADGMDGTPGGDEIDKANAAFIVRSVNSHDKLVEALRWYEEQASNCRKLGGIREGDDARAALDADGGQRARAALEGLE